jgi:hypothetical protein
MTLSKRTTVCVALVFALGLFSATAFGGVRDYGTPYTDVNSVTWSGTSHFKHPTSGLEGDIEWIVYGLGQFPYGDSGYHPEADEYSYVYQIINTGTAAISDFTFSVDQVVDNVDSFISSGRVEGVLAAGTDWSPTMVEWIFDPGINGGNTSAGLVFTSHKAPKTTETGRVTDSGTSAGVELLPAPGPNDIPEPGTFALLVAGLGLAVIVRRFSRR